MHFHSIGNSVSKRVDFKSEISPSEFYEELRLEGYYLYQYVTSDYTYNMEDKELDELGIEYVKFEFQKSTWLGLGKKTVYDLLILPNDKFYYPYQFGNYFYLLTKEKITGEIFMNWLNNEFPNRSSDFNDYIGGETTDSKKIRNESDIIIITLHDYQEESVITANKYTIDRLFDRLKDLELAEFTESKYDRIEKKNVV